mgnify:CR=1 FL=1
MDIEDIRTAGVVGGGTMGFGIALNFALAGIDIIVQDVTDEALARSEELTDAALSLFVEEDFVSSAAAINAAKRITRTRELEQLAMASDFVTEAIVERLDDKQELFGTLDRLCPDHTIIVTNTSGFVVSEIGEGVARQDKIGLTHYFAPPRAWLGLATWPPVQYTPGCAGGDVRVLFANPNPNPNPNPHPHPNPDPNPNPNPDPNPHPHPR